MLLLIPVLFAIIFIVLLAFSSNKKQVRVTRVDPTSGQQVVEIHESEGPNTARTAARGLLGCLSVIVFAAIILLTIVLGNAR